MSNFVSGAGAYSVTHNAVDVGLFEGALRQNQPMHAQESLASRFGDTVIDGVYRGTNVFAIMVVKEWTESVRDVIWPFDEALGNSGIIGRMLTDIAKVLVFTAIPGTPAATNGPLTRTYSLAVIAPEHNTEITFGAEERNIPVVMRCLPAITDSTGIAIHYVDTEP